MDDLVHAVAAGIDTLRLRDADAARPPRHGAGRPTPSSRWRLDLTKGRHRASREPIAAGCPCPACREHTRGYLHYLLRADELTGKRLMTLHNLTFMQRLMAGMREAILDGRLAEHGRLCSPASARKLHGPMRVVSDLPRPVRTLEHVWIPLSDGSRLGARIWLPEDAEDHPVPAVVDYIPYRKGDGTAPRDASRFAYLAGHGYAGVRVDIRGSGESDGVLTDEYLPQEQQDGVEVLRWLGEQSWCTGACGMIGISWGGFSGLQVAALRPPELKAVITLCSTDDRYADDVHYRGGAVLALEMLSWGTSMLSFNAMAPDPEIYGDGWRDAWLERIDGVEPYVHTWMEHQRRDSYWQQGSVCEDPAAIECAVYAVGGWVDGYSDAVLRLVESLHAPCHGLLGPWSHSFPDESEPGPSIGFMQECLRWWDRWLKEEETGVMDEPGLRAWMQEPWPRPRATASGRAAGSRRPSGPLPASRSGVRGLGDKRLHKTLPMSPAAASVSPRTLLCGLRRRRVVRGRQPRRRPARPARRGRRSLCASTAEPLGERLELLGHARCGARAGERPPGGAALRTVVSTCRPDGVSTSDHPWVLDLTHRDSHEHPEGAEPGAPLPRSRSSSMR